jgi:hypothetical protein
MNRNRILTSFLFASLALGIPGCAADAGSDADESSDLTAAAKTAILHRVEDGTASAKDLAKILPGAWTGKGTEGRNLSFTKPQGASISFALDVRVPNIVDLEATYGASTVQTMYKPAFISAMRALSRTQIVALGGSVDAFGNYTLQVKGSARLVGTGNYFQVVISPADNVPLAFAFAVSQAEINVATSRTFDGVRSVCKQGSVTNAGTACENPKNEFVPGSGEVDLSVSLNGGKLLRQSSDLFSRKVL